MLAACLACGHDNQRIITMANTTVKEALQQARS